MREAMPEAMPGALHERTYGRTYERGGSFPVDISPVRYAHEQKPDLMHGERRTYLAGCRCQPCTDANTAYGKRAELRRQRGFRGYVPHAQVVAHLDRLNAEGFTDHAIAKAAGVASSTLPAVRNRGKRLRASTMARILAVGEPCSGLVPADLTRQRLRSLMRAGWTLDEVQDRAGVRSLGGGKWRYVDRVRIDLAAAVRDLYRQIGDRPGTSLITAGKAKAAGWPLPAEWDDPGTLAWPEGAPADDEPAGPIVDVVAVDRWLRGDRTVCLSLDEKREAIRRAARFGVSNQELMRRWKWSGATFARQRRLALDDAA